ncbi:MAG: hypothetical protein WCV92_02655 [Candidatus Buchananbacteria bacterium]
MFEKNKKFVLIGLIAIVFAGFLFGNTASAADSNFFSTLTPDQQAAIMHNWKDPDPDKYSLIASVIMDGLVAQNLLPAGVDTQIIHGQIQNILGVNGVGDPDKTDAQLYAIIGGAAEVGRTQGSLRVALNNANLNPTSAAAQAATQKAIAASNKALDDATPHTASILEIIQNVLGWLIYLIFAALSWIITQLVWVMLNVMTYPINITDPNSAVVKGWVIVRNLCNNFFIVLMMVIAIGTIFRLPNYSKNLLPKILLAAILVNFSKMIVGIGIDISQVIMLSFASAFATVDGGNIVLSAIGLPSLAKIADAQAGFTNGGAGTFAYQANVIMKDNGGFSFINILTALVYAIIVAVIVLIVIAAITAILVARIIALLFLTILSPIYFFGVSFPAGKSKASEWLSNYTKYLFIGPTLLFFLWLSFMMMGYNQEQTIANQRASVQGYTQNGQATGDIRGKDPLSTQISAASATPTAGVGATELQQLSEAMSIPGMINTAMVIGMLCMCLFVAQKSGVAGSSFAKTGFDWIKKQGKRPMNMGKAIGKWGQTKVDRATGFRALRQGVGGYFAQRKKTAEDLDKRRAGIVAGTVAFGVGTAVGAPGKYIKKKWDKRFGITDDQEKIDKSADKLKRLDAEGYMKKINEAKIGDDPLESINGYILQRNENGWTATDAAHPDRVASRLERDDVVRLLSATIDDSHVKDIKDKKSFTESGVTYQHDEALGWRDSHGRVIGDGTDVGLRQSLDLSRGSRQAANIMALNGLDPEQRKAALNALDGLNDTDIGNLETELSKKRWKQAAVGKVVKGGLAVAGAATSPWTLPAMASGMGGLAAFMGIPGAAWAGGAAGTALGTWGGFWAGGAAGAAAGSGLANVSKWGDADKKFASSFKTNIAEEIRKGFKDLDNKELKAVLDDKSVDRFSRIAAGMEAISRGMLSKEQAKYEKSEIIRLSKTLPIAGRGYGNADKKISDNLDKELTKNYVDLSKLFTDLSDVTKRDGAMSKINGQIESGKLKMEDFDPKSLSIMGKQFAEALGTSKFGKQFENLSKAQQDAIRTDITNRAINGQAGTEERKVLLKLGDAMTAFRGANVADRRSVTTSLSVDDFRKFMREASDAQVMEFRRAVNNNEENLHRSVIASRNNEIRNMRETVLERIV